jgi:autotransporter adhesin
VTRANQQSFGTAANTYTMPGVTSAASRAAQTGPVSFVTSDSAGNLATSSLSTAGLVNLDGRVTGLEGRVASLESRFANLTTEARRGIAAASAFAPMLTPSAPGRTTVSLAAAGYRGEAGVGFTAAHRLRTSIPVVLNLGYANGGGQEHIVRGGIGFEF